jgi:ABC-type sugar transport system ATPase subunit
MLDEPLTNLDASIRIRLRIEFKKLHRELAQTIIYVTHDQVEAMTPSDRVAVIDQGRIQQIGSPDDV